MREGAMQFSRLQQNLQMRGAWGVFTYMEKNGFPVLVFYSDPFDSGNYYRAEEKVFLIEASHLAMTLIIWVMSFDSECTISLLA